MTLYALVVALNLDMTIARFLKLNYETNGFVAV